MVQMVVMVHWYPGTLVSRGTLAHWWRWTTGTLAHWSTGVAGGDWGKTNPGGGAAGRAMSRTPYQVIPNGGDIRVIY